MGEGGREGDLWFTHLVVCRFLLVGQSMPSVLDDDVIRDGESLSSRPFRNAGRAGRQLSLCGTPEKSSYRQMSLSERSSIRVEEIVPAARVAIQVKNKKGVQKKSLFPGRNALSKVQTLCSPDHGGGRLHLHRGLLHAPHLGRCSRPLGPGRQPSANQREPRLPPATRGPNQSQQYR